MHTWTFIRGLVVGAAVMYLMDPEGGGRRRAVVRDRGVGFWHDAQDFFSKAGRDLRNRIRGRVAVARGHLHHEWSSDDVVVERVRAKLGRYVSHPHAVKVTSEDGVVTLSGPILRAETERLISAISSVSGVREVMNLLEEHGSAENIPALQGRARAIGERPEWAQETWTPALQLLIGALGLAVMAIGTGVAVRARRQVQHGPDYAYLR
jgi:BON domain